MSPGLGLRPDAAKAIRSDGATQTRVHQIVSTIITKEVDPAGPLKLMVKWAVVA